MLKLTKIFLQDATFLHYSNVGDTKKSFFFITSIISSIIIWTVFKLLYKYPFISTDSYFYIAAAFQKVNVGPWPIGYSKFISLIGQISHSPNLLVSSQYFILQSSLLYFFFTVRAILKLSRWTTLILYIFLFFNPLFIFGCNHIMSDILFFSMTICWICQLLQILNQPKAFLIYTQTFLIVAIFSIRYAALFFPVFSIIIFLISKYSIRQKITGISITILLLASFIQFTRIEMENVSGVRLFSPSAGWRKASNALYMYGSISEKDKTAVPERFMILHQITKYYFKGPHTYVDLYQPNEEFTNGGFYGTAYESPLMQYTRIKKGQTNDLLDLKNCAQYSTLFNAYGNYLISHHLIAYIKYVILPNTAAYITPFPEVYGNNSDIYDLWFGHLGQITRTWTNLSSTVIPLKYITFREIILTPYPMIFAIIHIIFLLISILFVSFKNYKIVDQNLRSNIILIISFCFFNFIFTIPLTTCVIRYQLIVIILELTTTLILTDLFYKSVCLR